MSEIILAIDAMGGDFGPRNIVPAIKRALSVYGDLRFLVFGQENMVLPYLRASSLEKDCRVDFQHRPNAVTNNLSPLGALRLRDSSSLYAAVAAVGEGRASGVVSAGSTGALVTISDHVLGRIPGISRCSLGKIIPSFDRKSPGTVFLDLGASLVQTREMILQNAVIGCIVARCFLDAPRPVLGILNVGSEGSKGPRYLQEAAAVLRDADYCSFRGFAEGSDIFSGRFQVIVTDGFSGNIALKTAEGLYRGLVGRSGNRRNNLLLVPILHFFKRKIGIMQPDKYNGSTLLGLNGIVVKSHGSASQMAFMNAIIQARLQCVNRLPELIASQLTSM